MGCCPSEPQRGGGRCRHLTREVRRTGIGAVHRRGLVGGGGVGYARTQIQAPKADGLVIGRIGRTPVICHSDSVSRKVTFMTHLAFGENSDLDHVALNGEAGAAEFGDRQVRACVQRRTRGRCKCRDMPLCAAPCRSLERKPLIFFGFGFFFASQLRWRSAWRVKPTRESLPACHINSSESYHFQIRDFTVKRRRPTPCLSCRFIPRGDRGNP